MPRRNIVAFMTSRSGWLLRGFCLWTFFVFGTLIKNMITDTEHTLGFRVVHSAIGLMSIGLAAAVWPLAKRLDSNRQVSSLDAASKE